MKAKITVSRPSGEPVERVDDVTKDGELTGAVGKTFDDNRKQYPKAPPFQKTAKVEHALRSTRRKAPRDVIGNTVKIARIATCEEEDERSPIASAAAQLGCVSV